MYANYELQYKLELSVKIQKDTLSRVLIISLELIQTGIISPFIHTLRLYEG